MRVIILKDHKTASEWVSTYIEKNSTIFKKICIRSSNWVYTNTSL